MCERLQERVFDGLEGLALEQAWFEHGFARPAYSAAAAGADALLIVTEWKPFKSPDFALMKQLLRQPVVFDGRNLYEPARPRAAGLEYFSVGRD